MEFYEDHHKDDDDEDDDDDNDLDNDSDDDSYDDPLDNDDNPDDQGKKWHGMDRAISFCTHTMHTDERPDTLMRTMTMIVIFAYVIISSSVCYNVAMLMFV